MISRKAAHTDKGSRSNWLTTFNDMLTLMMVFFVLLFSMSTMDVEKVKRFKNSLQGALGVLFEGQRTAVKVSGGRTETRVAQPQERQTGAENGDLRESAVKEGRSSMAQRIGSLEKDLGIAATYSEKGVALSLEEGLLFDLGRADVNSRGRAALDKIGGVIRDYGNPVRVEGHTDNLPINTERFPSNWELSTARAVNVVKYFIQHGDIQPQRLSAVGYGDSKPAFPNDTVENRSRNRRVTLVLGMN